MHQRVYRVRYWALGYHLPQAQNTYHLVGQDLSDLLALIVLPATLLAMNFAMCTYQRTTGQIPMHIPFRFNEDGVPWKPQ